MPIWAVGPPDISIVAKLSGQPQEFTTNPPVVRQEAEEQRRNYSWPDSRGAAVEEGQVAP
jgi:hypothetical protein